MSGKPYTYTGTGTNSQASSDLVIPGNHWCSRADNDTGSKGYHYSNQDGSYYYKNTNGSTYYDNGRGTSSYTSPSGKTTTSTSKSK